MKITSTKDHFDHGIKALIFGPSGVGKTTLASTLTGKTIIISLESGLLSLSDYDIDVIDLSSYKSAEDRHAAIGEAYKYLLTNKGVYQNIYIDSLSEIASNLVLALKDRHPDRKDALVLWGEYSDKIKQIIRAFRDLSGYNVFFTALQATDQDESKRRFNGIDMAGKASYQCLALFDEVFAYRIVENEEGESKRFLQCHPSPDFVAKDRSGKLDKFERPDLGLIMKKIQGEKNV